MNKKGYVWLIAIVVIIVLAIYFLRVAQPDEDAQRADIDANPIKELGESIVFQGVRDPISVSKSEIGFEGFGPGKSHLGEFSEWNGELYLEEGDIVGFEGTIQSSSIDSEGDRLTDHLKSEDFLDVEKYPTIKFTSTELSASKLTGDLTFLGTKKEISFPVEVTDESISADFVLDTSLFGEMSSAANDEVRIFFELFK